MPKTRVFVVDDSVVIRRLLAETITQDPDFELAGWAAHGKLALAKIPQLNPDCIILDIEMPEMNGIDTLIEIRKVYPRLPVIMFSTLTERGAAKTLQALACGATDYVTKPANVGSVVDCIERLREELVPKIKAHASKPAPAIALPPAIQFRRPQSPTPTHAPEIVCIAASTGGPNALSAVIPALPANFPLPVVIVQHMPPIFTDLFAKRLAELSSLRAHEASEGQFIGPGNVYIAPGGKHLELAKAASGICLKLTEDPPENSCRPAADVLFRSVVKCYGSSILGVVLTGMGQDGLRGSQAIVEAGGRVIAQDQPSSVVWGMPGAVVQAGVAEQILPLPEIAATITNRCIAN